MKGSIVHTSRYLRINSTKSEQIVWELIRNQQLGVKFLRQYPVRFEYFGKKRFFIADFYCHKKKLVLEIDGKIHEKQKDYDEMRTFIINTLGISVFRIMNEETEKISELSYKIKMLL